MEHFERLHVGAAARAQVFQLLEEMFAGQLVAEQAQLQRAGFPRFADHVLRTQDDFVDRGAERVLGGMHIVGMHAERLGLAVDVGQKARHVLGKAGLVLRAATVLEQVQRIKALVHQVDQALRIIAAGAAVGHQGRRGAPFGMLAHAILAIGSSFMRASQMMV